MSERKNDAEASWSRRLRAMVEAHNGAECGPGPGQIWIDDASPLTEENFRAVLDRGEVGEDGVVYLGPGSGSGISDE